MNRNFIREKAEPEAFAVSEKWKIGVAGMSRGAGTTFIASCLAKILSGDSEKKVAFLEICSNTAGKKAMLYDALGMDKRFSNRTFIRFYQEIREARKVRGLVNLDEGINWALAAPEDFQDGISLTPLEKARLINNLAGDVIVCDLSCEDFSDSAAEMDVIFFVIDPLPSAMLSGFRSLQEMKRLAYQGKEVVFLINKFNPGINKRELHEFLKLRSYYQIPLLPIKHMYAAEYNCRIPYSMREIREELKTAISEIIKKHILIT